MTIVALTTPLPFPMQLAHLRRHIGRPDFSLFRDGVRRGRQRRMDRGDARAELRILAGRRPLRSLLASPSPFPGPWTMLIWLARHYEAGNIEPTDRLLVLLTKARAHDDPDRPSGRASPTWPDRPPSSSSSASSRRRGSAWPGFEASDAFPDQDVGIPVPAGEKFS